MPIATSPSLAVLALAAGLSLTTAILFGAAPASGATRRQSSRAQTVLVILQSALSLVLVVGSTMLSRSLANLEHQDFGYKVQGRVVVHLNRLPSTYSSGQLSSLYRDLELRLTALPDVHGAGLALYNPLTSNWWTEIAQVGGRPLDTSSESSACWDRVSADYLQNLGVTIVRGRLFAPADDETAAPVAIVNQSFVRRFLKGNEDPLDQQFGLDLPEYAGSFRIVGVIHDAKFAKSGLASPPRPMFFLPLALRMDYKTGDREISEERSHFIQGIVLVTNSPPAALEPLLRTTLSNVDPNLTITSVRTMQQLIELSVDRERAVARLAELFGMVALVLAGVGVYGATAFLVAGQTNEIGIRMAIGADRARIVRLVLVRPFWRLTVGLALGLPLAVGAARIMAAQLYGVSPWDPFTLTIASVSLVVCTFLAVLIPASRAAAISPISALRAQ